MIEAAKKVVKKIAHKMGVDISYVNNYEPELFEHVLLGSISAKKPLNILEIGANDGKYGDPIYEFIKNNKKNTKILLCEPNKIVIDKLKQNYEYHNSAEILCKAVSSKSGSVKMYMLKKKYWNMLEGYGKNNWPTYRKATGVTTAHRDEMIRWVRKNIKNIDRPEKAIDCFEVEAIRPKDVLEESELLDEVDILQIDAEGMDSQIVYAFLNDNIYPGIINIEHKKMDNKSYKKYNKKLIKKGYKVLRYKDTDTIAVKTG